MAGAFLMVVGLSSLAPLVRLHGRLGVVPGVSETSERRSWVAWRDGPPAPELAPIRIVGCFGTRTRRDPASSSWPHAGDDRPDRAVREDLRGLRFRIRCVRTAITEGIAAALALGVGRASLHRWRRRYAAGGIEALRQRPRGPTRERLPAWVERAVIVVRLLTYWNSKRLAAEFARRASTP